MSELLSNFVKARKVSTPLICIKTPDPAATIATLTEQYAKDPVMVWDIARGIQPKTDKGFDAMYFQLAKKEQPEEPLEEDAKKKFLEQFGLLTQNLFETLVMITRLPKSSILFISNAHRLILPDKEQTPICQAIWNLRDLFRNNQRTLVLLCPDIQLPLELQQDIFILDEPLPDREEIAAIVKKVYSTAKIDEPETPEMEKYVDALTGIAAFPARQAAFMSLRKTGLQIDELWERKRTMIESCKGLSVNRSGETFADIGGCNNAKKFFERVIDGIERPRAVVFIDEIEKMTASGSDSDSVGKGFLGTTLTYMTDHNVNGSILIGPPGAAKSALAKAIGNTAKIPTISMDMNGMKGSFVGESEAALRQSYKIITAISQDRALFIATCNSIDSLPPELRRRFTFGTFFFDLPTDAEREMIWFIYYNKFNIPGDAPRPKAIGWTGAEIKQCCFIAYNLRMTPLEASAFIVPVATSAAENISRLRKQANGRFISASYPGTYKYQGKNDAPKPDEENDSTYLELEN